MSACLFALICLVWVGHRESYVHNGDSILLSITLRYRFWIDTEKQDVFLNG